MWTYNINDCRVGTAHQGDETNEEAGCICNRLEQVLLGEHRTLSNVLEPKNGGEVEGEARNEERGADGQQVVEERNGLGNDPCNDGHNCDQSKPRNPTHPGVDKADGGILENTAMDVTCDTGSVDRSRDEDDRQRQTESNLGHEAAGRQQSWRLDIGTNKGVDQGSSQGVNEDFDQTQGPDGLDIVLGRVHLVHEGELADGETVSEDDVGNSDKRFVECEVILGPCRPVDGCKTAGGVGALHTSCNHRDQNCYNDGNKVDVSQDGDFGERRGNSQEEQDNGRHDTEYNRACSVVSDVLESDRAGQGVRADKEDELQTEHGTDQFVSKAAGHESSGICVVLDLGELDLDLANNVTRVDGDESQANCHNDTSNHTQGGKGSRDTQTSEGDGFDNKDDGQTSPAETVEVGMSLGLDLADLTDGLLARGVSRGHVLFMLSLGSIEAGAAGLVVR